MTIALLLSLTAGCGADRPPAEMPADSLYALSVELETATGDHGTLALHRDHPVLLSMVYASCSDVCPATVTTLRAIESQLPEDRRNQLRVLLVSLDPDDDTRDALTRFAAHHELDRRWTLARASSEDVREIAATLGVRYRSRPDGTIDHNTVVVALDEQGVVQARTESLGSTDALVTALAGGR